MKLNADILDSECLQPALTGCPYRKERNYCELQRDCPELYGGMKDYCDNKCALNRDFYECVSDIKCQFSIEPKLDKLISLLDNLALPKTEGPTTK